MLLPMPLQHSNLAKNELSYLLTKLLSHSSLTHLGYSHFSGDYTTDSRYNRLTNSV